jgi:spore germination protein YaaH
MRKKLIIIFSFIFFVLFICLFLIFKPNNEKINLFKNEKYPIIQEGKVLKEHFYSYQNNAFVPLSFVTQQIDETLYYDKSIRSIIFISNSNNTNIYPLNKAFYYRDNKKFDSNISVIEVSEQVYVSVDLINSLYPGFFHFNAKNNLLVFHTPTENQTFDVGKSNNDSPIRADISIKSPIISTLKEKEKLMILNQKEDWYFVQDSDGYYGYIQKKYIDVLPKKVSPPVNTNTKKQIVQKINLAWEAVYQVNPDPKTIKISGVNVISPTWFHLENKKGDVFNNGDLAYQQWAKKRNMKIWALYSNSFDPNLTHAFLTNYHARANSINQLLALSSMYQLDGINIDFENVYLEDKANFVQYVKEVTAAFHKVGKTISVDITFPGGSDTYSNFINRKALGSIADYIMVMAYDEHWATSPTAGSVASLPWVEEGLNNTLKEIPNDKLILGMPFYMRVWKTNLKTNEVSSATLSMMYMNDWIKRNKVKPIYDALTKQYYVQFKKDNELVQVWFEDVHSVTSRINLVHKYDLAGIGIWTRNFANDVIWKYISENLNK